jgi:uncharacterized membrane protein
MTPMNEDFAKLFGHLHPVLVHFPIASVFIATLLEWVALARRGMSYGPGIRGLLVCGVAIGIVTILSGLKLEEEFAFDAEQTAVLERHELMGYLGVGAALLAVILGEAHRRAPSRGKRIAYLVILHVAAGFIAVGAAAGGLLVWGADWLPW